jgi:hypothetical protein
MNVLFQDGTNVYWKTTSAVSWSEDVPELIISSGSHVITSENAAINILSLGLKTLGFAPGSRLL